PHGRQGPLDGLLRRRRGQCLRHHELEGGLVAPAVYSPLPHPESVVLGILLALQTAGPASCTPAALCRLLDSAAATNRAMMLTPGGYRAVVETETATLGRVEGRVEGATLLEQTSSTVSWSPDGGFAQHV